MPARPPFNYWDNISKPNELLDNGLKVARAGYDATTASNTQLLFNSSWPSMQIFKVLNVDTTVTPSYNHNLKYPPLALIFNTDMGDMSACSVDEDNVYFSDPINVRLGNYIAIIYTIDISTDVDYPYTDAPGASVQYNNDYGIKVVKPGRDITSSDLRDFILHSRAGSPMVLAVKTEATSNPQNAGLTFPKAVQYTSNVGYQTLVFGFQGTLPGYLGSGSKGYIFAPQQSQLFPTTSTTGTTSLVRYQNVGGGFDTTRGSLVVLRSPMFSSKRVSVTF